MALQPGGELHGGACHGGRWRPPRRLIALAVGPRERQLSLRVFGRLPGAGARGCTEAGVRKASREETAGEFAPAVVKTGFRTPRADRKRGGDEEEKSGTLCLIHLRFAVDSPLERDRL